MKRRRGRSLLPEEVALWRFVTRSVRPLPGHDAPPEPAPPAPSAQEAGQETSGTAKPGRAAGPAPRKVEKRPPAPPPLAPLERRQLRDLRRGIRQIDARIDLHGMRQAEAHHALTAFLRHAQAQGARIVLVVTGKGDASAGDTSAHADLFSERGVLRRLTPHWLDQPDLRPVVIGYSRASREHGGDGALYVRLRRPVSGRGR
ncbi:Smr/MutS family protein [Pseudochelatococcus sp. B33]